MLIGAGLAAYHNSFGGPFIFDDEWRIVGEAQIRHLWPPWRVMVGSTRPLVQLSLAGNYAVGGLNVWGYHAFNLTVHLLAGLLLFGVVRRMLEGEKLRTRYGRAGRWLAATVALLWLLHPLQTESVTYLIQRAEALMGLFLLLTLYCVIRGSRSPRRRAWYLTAVVACLLGAGGKEVMVSAPLVVLLYDRLFIAPSFRELFRRRWALYAGLAGTWLVLAGSLATSQPEQQEVLTTGLTPWRYALTQFGVIVHYLRLSFWPHPLVLDYAWPLADSVSSVVPWAIVVLALLAGTVLALYRQAWVGFWGAWFFLILAPTSSILPIADVAFEHRMYLPLAAVVVLVTIGAHEALGLLTRRGGTPEKLRPWLAAGLTVAAVGVLGYATVLRNEDYRSDVAIWSDTVAKRASNPRAHLNLGRVLQRRGQISDAIAHYSEALRLTPGYARAHNNLGAALALQGQNNEAFLHFEEAVRLNPSFAEAQRNLGRALLNRGQVQQAIPHLETAVRLKPQLAEALNDLRSVQPALEEINRGVALDKQGKTDEAIAHFSEAVRLKPDYADAHSTLALALAKRGRNQEAIVHYSEALRLKPDSPDTLNNLGAALYREGRTGEAIHQYSAALRLKPSFAEAHSNLGLALAKQGETQEAIDHFSEAVRLQPGYAQAHNNLGALLHRRGRTTEAIAHFSEALRLQPDFVDAQNNLRAAAPLR